MAFSSFGTVSLQGRGKALIESWTLLLLLVEWERNGKVYPKKLTPQHLLNSGCLEEGHHWTKQDWSMFSFPTFFFFLIPRTVVTFTWHYSCQLHVCSHIGFRQPQIQEIEVEQCPQTMLWDPRRMRRSKRSCAQLANQVGPQRIC